MQCENLHVDVLVIGAGPAGSSAAAKVARGGNHVLIVDRRMSPGLPVQCAEWVPKFLACMPAVRRASVQEVDAMVSHIPGMSSDDIHFPGIMLDRSKLDRELQDMAQENGAVLWRGACFKGISRVDNLAFIEKDGKVYRIFFDVLIAADGPRSRVACHLGMPALGVIQSRQYTVPLTKTSVSVSVWLSGQYPGGYAWLFPKGGVANLGVGFETGSRETREPRTLKKRLDELLSCLVTNGTVEDQILTQTGGPIPVSGLRDPLVSGNILFAGDAAGCANPLTGAGISSAMMSGEMAGEFACEYLLTQDDDSLLAYQDELRSILSPSLDRDGVSRRRLKKCWHSPAGIDHDELRRCWVGFDDYIYQGQGGERVNGMC